MFLMQRENTALRVIFSIFWTIARNLLCTFLVKKFCKGISSDMCVCVCETHMHTHALWKMPKIQNERIKPQNIDTENA